MNDTANQLVHLFAELPRASTLRRQTIAQLRDDAAARGFDVSDLRRKDELVQALTHPAEILARTDGVHVIWSVSGDGRTLACVAHEGEQLLVDARFEDELSVEVQANTDGDIPGVIRRHGLVISEFRAGPSLGEDDLLDILDRAAFDQEPGEIWLEGFGPATGVDVEGRTRWLTEDPVGISDDRIIVTSHWCYRGGFRETPGNAGYGSLCVHERRGLLVGFEPEGGEQYYAELPRGPLTGGDLAERLGSFGGWLVNQQTSSLSLPEHFTDADVASFLDAATDQGADVLHVNGKWWAQTARGWTCALPPAVPPPPVRAHDLVGLSVDWFGRWTWPAAVADVILLPDHGDPSLLPIGLAAAHKVEWGEPVAVGLVFVHLVGGDPVPGLATTDGGGLARLLGTEPALRIDADDESVWLRAPDGSWTELDVLLDIGTIDDAELYAAGDWLKAPSGDNFLDHRGLRSRAGQARLSESDADASPTAMEPPFVLVRDLEPGDERYVWLSAIGRDDQDGFWIDPDARARRAGLPGEDPVVRVDEAGTLSIDLRDISAAMPARGPRHTRPLVSESR